MGRGRSQVASGETKAATLILFAGFKAKERGVGDPEFERFATLAGRVSVKGRTRAEFLLGDDAKFEFDQPAPSDGTLVRELQVRFDAASFPDAPKDASFVDVAKGVGQPASGSGAAGGVPASTDGADADVEDGAASNDDLTKASVKEPANLLTKLRLPSGPADAKFLEIAIELQVDGAVETGHLENDRLDVPLREVVEIVLIDDDDDPIPGAMYEVQSGLSVLSGLLDEEGFARVDHLPSRHNKVTFPEFAPASNVVPVPDEDVPASLKGT